MRAAFPWAIYSRGEKCFVFSGGISLHGCTQVRRNARSGAQNSGPCTVNELCVACIFVMLRQEMRGYVLQLSSQLRWGM
jgi:hypothetical protein